MVPSVSNDFPYIVTIGPSFFESYETWPGVKFSHGFNLGKNGTAGMNTLLATVPLACKALSDGKLAYWELGNEPDRYKNASTYAVRPASWNESDYVSEWLPKARIIKRQLAKSCPGMADKFIAPSFAGLTYHLNPVKTWQSGLDSDDNILMTSMHK